MTYVPHAPRGVLFLALLLGSTAPILAADAPRIDTRLGGGLPRGVPATEVGLGSVHGLALDHDGALLLSSSWFGSVLRVRTDGTIEPVAGTGVPALGAARTADPEGFQALGGIALDGKGGLWIADGRRVVRQREGRLESFLGSVTDDKRPAGERPHDDETALLQAVAVAADADGNAYVVDREGHRIRRVDGATGKVANIAGEGEPGFEGDGGPPLEAEFRGASAIARDAAGRLYIADTYNNRVRRISADGRQIDTIAGSGKPGPFVDGSAALAASLDRPNAIAVAADGGIVFTEERRRRILRLDPTTATLALVADLPVGGGPPSALLAAPDGRVFVADGNADHVLVLKPGSRDFEIVAGSGGRGLPPSRRAAGIGAVLDETLAVAVDPRGGYIVGEPGRVLRVADDGRASVLAGTGFVGDGGDGGPADAAQLSLPLGLVVDSRGNVYIADAAAHRVRRVDAATGTITTVAGTGRAGQGPSTAAASQAPLRAPSGLAFDRRGRLHIADTGNHRVVRIDAPDKPLVLVSGNGLRGYDWTEGVAATKVAMAEPRALAFDARDHLYIADRGTHRIRRVDAGSGFVSNVAGTGAPGFGGDNLPAATALLAAPVALAIDASGRLFVAERDGHRVRWIDLAISRIHTLAGDGNAGHRGDGGPARDARVAAPQGLALDGRGGLLVADTGSRRVRRITGVEKLEAPPLPEPFVR